MDKPLAHIIGLHLLSYSEVLDQTSLGPGEGLSSNLSRMNPSQSVPEMQNVPS